MTRRTQLLLGIALLLALGWLGSYLLGRLEPYEETISHGPDPEAQANPYLAAEHFLRLQGLQVQRADGLDVLKQLPSAGQTLLLLGDRNQGREWPHPFIPFEGQSKPNRSLKPWVGKGVQFFNEGLQHLWIGHQLLTRKMLRRCGICQWHSHWHFTLHPITRCRAIHRRAVGGQGDEIGHLS